MPNCVVEEDCRPVTRLRNINNAVLETCSFMLRFAQYVIISFPSELSKSLAQTFISTVWVCTALLGQVILLVETT